MALYIFTLNFLIYSEVALKLS